MNKVLLSGIVQQEPVIVRFADTNRLARFTIGVNRVVLIESANPQWSSSYFNIVIFNEKLDQVLSQLKKGANVSLDGYLTTPSYTNKSGDVVETIEIVVDSMEIE